MMHERHMLGAIIWAILLVDRAWS